MKTTNLLGFSDQLMVQRVLAEKPAGGPITMAIYDRYSSFGFSRLRRSNRFYALSDLERQEAAYNAAVQFLRAILEARYIPHDKTSSEAYYWTICKRRAFDFLRKLAASERQANGELKNEPPATSFAPAAFVFRTSIDDPDYNLQPGEEEKITTYLDTQLIWKIIRRDLGKPCRDILTETLQKDRSHEEVAHAFDYSLKSVKTLKNRCLKELRGLLRDEL